MTLHREGRTTIILAVIASLATVLVAHYVFGHIAMAQPLAWALAVFLLAVVLQFFRKPARKMHNDPNAIIAPCDGKVVVIEEVEDTEYFNAKVRQVSIFMSPTNVHINWFPLSGKVVYSKYHAGKYLVAWHPKSSTENERHSVVVRHPQHGEVLVKQIAGVLARRVVSYAPTGTEATQGAEMGFIKFGSRVDLLFPLSAKVAVNLQEKSIGGKTVIASFAE